jgi:predicted nucleic acid-binding Zn ribbon protein
VPTYQYRCEDCGKTFERTETMSEHEVAKRSARNVGAGTSPLCRTASTW